MSKGRFNPAFPIASDGGKAAQNFRDYMTALDALISALLPQYTPTLVNAANDAAAAAAGVPLKGLYVNGSVVMQRQV